MAMRKNICKNLCIIQYLFYVAVFLHVTLTSGEVKIGDPCVTPLNLTHNATGSCLLLDNCASVMDDYEQGRDIPVCFKFRETVVVCCKSSEFDVKPVRTTFPVRRGALAKKKCYEYALADPTCRTGEVRNSTSPIYIAHTAAIGFTKKSQVDWLCSGSLISPTFVLTSASCTYYGIYGPAVLVRIGQVDLNANLSKTQYQERRVVQTIIHPRFNWSSTIQHNIGLLRLEKRIQFNRYVRPACLSGIGVNNAISKMSLLTMGWGHLRNDKRENSSILVQSRQFLVDDDSCNKTYEDLNTEIVNNEKYDICTKSLESSRVCLKHDGVSLVYPNDDYSCELYDIVGVASVRPPCNSKYPRIYSRIYVYLSWIESIVWSGNDIFDE